VRRKRAVFFARCVLLCRDRHQRSPGAICYLVPALRRFSALRGLEVFAVSRPPPSRGVFSPPELTRLSLGPLAGETPSPSPSSPLCAQTLVFHAADLFTCQLLCFVAKGLRLSAFGSPLRPWPRIFPVAPLLAFWSPPSHKPLIGTVFLLSCSSSSPASFS